MEKTGMELVDCLMLFAIASKKNDETEKWETENCGEVNWELPYKWVTQVTEVKSEIKFEIGVKNI
jgi:hypothetical protein